MSYSGYVPGQFVNEVYEQFHPELFARPSMPRQGEAYVEFLRTMEGTQEGATLLTFSEIEQKLENGAAELKDHASKIFHSGVIALAADVKEAEAKAKAEALVIVKDATPEIQAAVQAALEMLEKAILAEIESHLA